MKSIFFLGLWVTATAICLNTDDALYDALTESEGESADDPMFDAETDSDDEDSMQLTASLPKPLVLPPNLPEMPKESKESAVILTLRNSPILFWHSKKEILTKLSTGYSPKLGKNELHTLDEILMQQLELKVHVLASPLSEGIPEVRSVRIITFDDELFLNGEWAFVDPLFPDELVYINCDHPNWDRVTNKLVKDLKIYDITNPTVIMLEISKFINNNLELFEQFLVYSPNFEFVCRHYATLSLAVFSRLFKHSLMPFDGIIKFLSGDLLGNDWQRQGEGHAWNIVTFFLPDDEEETYYFDAYNNIVISLDQVPDKDERMQLYALVGDNYVAFKKGPGFFEVDCALFSQKQLGFVEQPIINDSPDKALIAAAKTVMNKTDLPTATVVNPGLKRRLF